MFKLCLLEEGKKYRIQIQKSKSLLLRILVLYTFYRSINL